MMNEIYLNREQAAEFLRGFGLKTTTKALAKLAVVGGGPVFRKFGHRALYVRADLESWFREGLSEPKSSTSEQR